MSKMRSRKCRISDGNQEEDEKADAASQLVGYQPLDLIGHNETLDPMGVDFCT